MLDQKQSYPPGNNHISHQTGKPEHHRLKSDFLARICDVSSLEGISKYHLKDPWMPECYGIFPYIYHKKSTNYRKIYQLFCLPCLKARMLKDLLQLLLHLQVTLHLQVMLHGVRKVGPWDVPSLHHHVFLG